MAAHELAMPSDQGGRGDEKDRPPVPGYELGQTRQHGTVGVVEPRAGDLALEDADLVAKHSDLDVVVSQQILARPERRRTQNERTGTAASSTSPRPHNRYRRTSRPRSGTCTPQAGLYRSFGFVPCAPYVEDPTEGVLFFELALTSGSG